jgi:hypothetical protein
MASRVSAYPLCRHTKTDGRLCQSPALIDSAYCHHHRKLHRTRRNAISAGPGLSTHVLHPLRNARSIQQALGMTLNALWSGQLHPRKAGKMIYALQIAGSRKQQGPIE